MKTTKAKRGPPENPLAGAFTKAFMLQLGWSSVAVLQLFITALGAM